MGRRNMPNGVRKTKIQATLEGYQAWAFTRLVSHSGEKQVDIMKWIVREWLEQRSEHLESTYGISQRSYDAEHGRNVAQFKGRSKKTEGS